MACRCIDDGTDAIETIRHISRSFPQLCVLSRADLLRVSESNARKVEQQLRLFETEGEVADRSASRNCGRWSARQKFSIAELDVVE
eukprot:SAG11_NODE_3328_length_2521_cov_6.520231_3_plen_86_part_00